jgi:hypothetical protein
MVLSGCGRPRPRARPARPPALPAALHHTVYMLRCCIMHRMRCDDAASLAFTCCLSSPWQ